MVAQDGMTDVVLLAVKVGNAETAMGLFDGDELLGTWAVSTDRARTVDEAQLDIQAFLDTRGLPAPDEAIICSVVPASTETWIDALHAVCRARPLVVGPGLKSGIAMGYKDPAQLGSDRVVNAVAARALFGSPVIVADFGTATSLTVVDSGGRIAGGVIAPGLRTSLEALCDSAAQLAEVGMEMPRSVVGRTTADAIRSGVLLGEAARVDGLVDAIWDEIECETQLVATGRFANVVCDATYHEFAVRADLALVGLRLIWQLNRR